MRAADCQFMVKALQLGKNEPVWLAVIDEALFMLEFISMVFCNNKCQMYCLSHAQTTIKSWGVTRLRSFKQSGSKYATDSQFGH